MEESNDTNRTANAQTSHYYFSIDNCDDQAMHNNDGEDVEANSEVSDDDVDDDDEDGYDGDNVNEFGEDICESSFTTVAQKTIRKHDNLTDDFYYYNENLKSNDNNGSGGDKGVEHLTSKTRSKCTLWIDIIFFVSVILAVIL